MPPRYSFINKKFHEYEEYFAQQKQNLLKQLTEWREQKLKEIDQHVKAQERFIKDIFANKAQDILAQRDALVEKYKQLQGRDDSHIRALVGQCDVLKSQLVNTRYERQEIDYIELTLCLSNGDQDKSCSSVSQSGQHHAQIEKSTAAARSTSDRAGAISRSESRNRRRQYVLFRVKILCESDGFYCLFQRFNEFSVEPIGCVTVEIN